MTPLEISVIEQDVGVLFELVAFHQLLPVEPVIGLSVLRHHPDTVAGLRIDQVEADAAAVVLGAVERHRAGDEREAKMAAPDRTLRHI